MSKVYDKFAKPEEMAFYMMLMGKDGNEALTEPSCWILAKYYREVCIINETGWRKITYQFLG